MKYKVVLVIIFFLGLVAWTLAYYRINNNIKQPVETVYNQGESFMYYGLEITPEEIIVYDRDQFSEKYDYAYDEYFDYETYIIEVRLHVRNLSGYDVKIKENMHTWEIETDYFRNGQIMFYSYINEVDPYKKDSDAEYKLFFTFREGGNYHGGIERLQNSSKDIYMSFYPEARYIHFD